MEESGLRKKRSSNDSLGKSSAEEDEAFCHPCSHGGDWVVAVGYCQNCNEFFCAACLKPHRNQSMSRYHVILEGFHMLRSLMSPIQIDPCSEPCDQHTNEIVKFYCFSHDVVGCSDCMVLDHKTCKLVKIQEISRNYFDSVERRDLIGKVDKFLNDLDKLKHQVRRNKQNNDQTCNKAVNDINAFRQEVNDYLDKAEAEILMEVNNRKKTVEQMMTKLEAEKQCLQDEIKELEEKLNQQSNKANELFVAAKKLKERMSSLDANLEKMFQQSQVKQYRFEPSSEVRQIMTSKVPLGSLSQKKIEDMLPQFDGEINVRAPGEKRSCLMISPVIISPTQIVLVDHSNMCVKLVDIRQRKLLTRYGFSTPPTDVARIKDNTIAVALPEKQKIQFLSITQDNQFTQEREMIVNFEGRKLLFLQDKIIIACKGKIKFLNSSGNAEKEISFPNLTWPTCIAPSNDFKSFFVGCQYAAIYKFNFDGSLVATYKDNNLSDLGELTVTRDGIVFACNWSASASIHVVTPEFKNIKEILQHNEHVRKPWCVSYCEETNTLFVCNFLGYGSNDKLNDVLKIFQMY